VSSLARDVRLVARGWRWSRRPPLPRSAARWAPTPQPREFPTAWARSPAAVAARQVVLGGGFRSVLQAKTRVHVDGLDRLAGLAGPVVFVAPHASHMDTPLLLTSLPVAWRRRTAVAAAADYFFDSAWRAAATALAFATFPVERGTGRISPTASALLAAGWSLLVYPEGTRSADGWVGQLRHGASHLACAAGVPVVPVAVRGTYAAMPRGRSWPVPGRPPVSVRFGVPVPTVGEDGAALDPHDVTERARAELARLVDEDAVGWYASLRRAADGTTPSLSGPAAARWRRVWEATQPLEPRGRAPVWGAAPVLDRWPAHVATPVGPVDHVAEEPVEASTDSAGPA
jgi:1-acyl-sn-glycerol-3-phosphate acyltransferase